MKFSGKMCLKIILKVTKNQGFTLSLEDTFFEKLEGGSQFEPPPIRHIRVNRLLVRFVILERLSLSVKSIVCKSLSVQNKI